MNRLVKILCYNHSLIGINILLKAFHEAPYYRRIPAKAKTIKNFLDKNYEVIASKGHVRDLSKFALGIKIDETGFTPNYVVDKDHKELVKQIIELSKKASITYIATDERQRGEAIGYHVACLIGGNWRAILGLFFMRSRKMRS